MTPFLILVLTLAGPAPAAARVTAEDYQRWGDECMQKGDYGCAVNWYKQLTEADPKEGWNWLHLGNAFYLKDDYENAISSLEEALQRGPKKSIFKTIDKTLNKTLGRIFFVSSPEGEAPKARLERIARRVLGHCHVLREEWAPARSNLERSLRRPSAGAMQELFGGDASSDSPDEAWTLDILSVVAYKSGGNLKEAQDFLNRALRADPNYGPAWARRGWIRILGITEASSEEADRVTLNDALEDFEKAAALDQESAQFQFNQGLVHLIDDLGAHRLALDAIDKVGLKVSQRAPTMYFNRGVCHKALGDFSSAREDFQRALRGDASLKKEARRELAEVDAKIASSQAAAGPQEPAQAEPADAQPASPGQPAPSAPPTLGGQTAVIITLSLVLLGLISVRFTRTPANNPAAAPPKPELPPIRKLVSVANLTAAPLRLVFGMDERSTQWLRVSPEASTLAANSSQDLEITFLPSKQPPGPDLGSIRIAAEGGEPLAEIAVVRDRA